MDIEFFNDLLTSTVNLLTKKPIEFLPSVSDSPKESQVYIGDNSAKNNLGYYLGSKRSKSPKINEYFDKSSSYMNSYSRTNSTNLSKGPISSFEQNNIRRPNSSSFSNKSQELKLKEEEDINKRGAKSAKGSFLRKKTEEEYDFKVKSYLKMEEEEYWKFAINHKLTKEEIDNYEKFSKRPVLSREEFMKYISTPILKEAIVVLKLSDKKAQGEFLKYLSPTELVEEKNRVKGHLKHYDKVFKMKVGTVPSNKEKEPLK
jgi:hypothetical protein